MLKNNCLIKSEHLDEVNMSYIDHLKFSLGLSKIFLESSVKAIIHALLPDIFITSSTDSIKLLNDKMHFRSKL